MDSFKFQDVKIEKQNAISRYRRIQRITTLFRFFELFVFLFIISNYSTRFVFSFELEKTIEHIRGISLTLIRPRFVFILGNVIVVVLFLLSRQISSNNGEASSDFYEAYVEKCRKDQQARIKHEKKALVACRYAVCSSEKINNIRRSRSENNLRSKVVVREDKRRSELRRCTTSSRVGRSFHVEDGMSSEDFRQTVEAFIARRQRLLKEEEEHSAAIET